MIRAEKRFELPKGDKNFPISGFRSACDPAAGLIYLVGGKTDGNFTTPNLYQLKQVAQEEGKQIDIKKLAPMTSTRAYHGSVLIHFKDAKFLVVAGGQQTKRLRKTDSSMTGDSSDFSAELEADLPRVPLAECELYDVAADRWTELPKLKHKKSNVALCQMGETGVVYCFGGWDGRESVNHIERLYIGDFATGLEAAMPAGPGEEAKSGSKAGPGKGATLGTWTEVLVKEAGLLGGAPDSTLFRAANSMG